MSYSEKRDDLNQWRSYTPSGRGVCIGFDHKSLIERAQAQVWDWSNCKYDYWDQERWADSAITRLVKSAVEKGPNSAAHPEQIYDEAFHAKVETLLQIACRIKHPAFKEEHEWRFISQYIPVYADPRIQFRSGDSTMIPFTEFGLGSLINTPMINEVTVGPTMHVELSINAIAAFLSPRTKSVSIRRSAVPYRPL